MTFITQRTKLVDCDHTANTDGQLRELILVEGDSASKSVVRVRDARLQAVLPMQGKPMNATKASVAAVRKNPWFAALVDAMGIGWNGESIAKLRYGRILFLFDPDADGIHCGALMLMFFETYFGELLDGNRLAQIKPPQFEIRAAGYHDTVQAYSETHRKQIQQALAQRGICSSYHRYRGLGSLNDTVLRETCVAPESRTVYLLRRADAEAARRIFCRPRERDPTRRSNGRP